MNNFNIDEKKEPLMASIVKVNTGNEHYDLKMMDCLLNNVSSYIERFNKDLPDAFLLFSVSELISLGISGMKTGLELIDIKCLDEENTLAKKAIEEKINRLGFQLANISDRLRIIAVNYPQLQAPVPAVEMFKHN
jgi:hypothetical protein